jgi:colanic acid biosynthesis glycosyl transferase WcaI
MRVAIVSINYAPERTGIGVYTTGMAEFLAARGGSVTVHTGFPYYPEWTKRATDRRRLFRRERAAGVELRRCYLYVPHRPNAARRIVHELSFALSSALSYLCAPRAEHTIIVSPPLALGVTIGLLAKLKRSRVLFHVQDLQPDAAIELGMLRPGTLTALLLRLERACYAIADRVSTISPGMMTRIESKGIERSKLFLLRNWANDDVVAPLDRDTALRREWGLTPEHFVALYSGNLGQKQGLESLLLAAGRLASEPRVRVVIVGDGVERAALERKAAGLGLNNVLFRPLQPVERLAELLATADVCVMPQKKGIGDIVLPSKLANILAAARPVIAAASQGSDLEAAITAGGFGFVVPPEDATALAQSIIALESDPPLLAEQGRRARKYAVSYLQRDAVLVALELALGQGHRGNANVSPHCIPTGQDAPVRIPPD